MTKCNIKRRHSKTLDLSLQNINKSFAGNIFDGEHNFGAAPPINNYVSNFVDINKLNPEQAKLAGFTPTNNNLASSSFSTPKSGFDASNFIGKAGNVVSGVTSIIDSSLKNAKIADTTGIENNIEDFRNTDFSEATDSNSLINAYNNLNFLKDDYSWKDVRGVSNSELFGNTLSAVGSGAMAGASVGGPWGAVAGAAIGLGGSLAGIFTGKNKAKRKARFLNQASKVANNTAIDNYDFQVDDVMQDNARNAMKYAYAAEGGPINIKKKNRGKFTESANRAGMGVQEFARHVLANKDKYSSTLVKRANFATAGWKHDNGGWLGTGLNENVATALSFVPVVGTLMDGAELLAEPSWENAGWFLSSLASDIFTGGAGKAAFKSAKLAKAAAETSRALKSKRIASALRYGNSNALDNLRTARMHSDKAKMYTKDMYDNIMKGLAYYGADAGLNAAQQSTKANGGFINTHGGDFSNGGPIKNMSFEDWYKTVPTDRNDTTTYNLRRAYELAPFDELEAWRTSSVKDLNSGKNHLRSVYLNPDTGIYEFMKSKNHPTLHFETDWYNSNDPEAIKFRNNYNLDMNGDYYKYVPKKKAFGGELNTHGGDFSNGVTFINNGGTHEQNPFEGVPMGIAPDGKPNLVEEGEVLYNDYVFSNRLHPTDKELKESNLPKKYKGHTFALIAEDMSKESAERPNDPISKRGLEASLGKLASLQEEQRMKKGKIGTQQMMACGGRKFAGTKNTFSRYAPIVGSAKGAVKSVFQKPDYTNSDLILDAVNNLSRNKVSPTLLNEYLNYNPIDRNYYLNQLKAQSGATRRALMNSGINPGQRIAGLLAADYNAQQGIADTLLKSDMYNEQLKQNRAQFNRGTSQYNSGALMQAAAHNAQLAQARDNMRLSGISTAANMRELADTALANSRSDNLTNFFDNLGALGRENRDTNMLQSMIDSDLFGALSESMKGGWRKNGGMLTKRCRKRRK